MHSLFSRLEYHRSSSLKGAKCRLYVHGWVGEGRSRSDLHARASRKQVQGGRIAGACGKCRLKSSSSHISIPIGKLMHLHCSCHPTILPLLSFSLTSARTTPTRSNKAAVDHGIPVLHSSFLQDVHARWISASPSLDVNRVCDLHISFFLCFADAQFSYPRSTA